MSEVWTWFKSLVDTWQKLVTGSAITALLLVLSTLHVLPAWATPAWLVIAVAYASFLSWRVESRQRLAESPNARQRKLYIESTCSLLQALNVKLSSMQAEVQQHHGTSSASNHCTGVEQVLTSLLDTKRTEAIGNSGLEARVHNCATMAADMLCSKKMEFRPGRPMGWVNKMTQDISGMRQRLLGLCEQLRAESESA
ncbi:MAG: hypothetical protein WA304_05055 [Candidatus Cybelea sp.]